MKPTPAWKNFVYEILFYVVGGLVFLLLYWIWDTAQTPARLSGINETRTLEALEKVEVVSAEIYRRSQRHDDVFVEFVLKNANSFRVHDVQVSCAAFDSAGLRIRTQQEKFKRLRSHSLMKFRRERAFKHWSVSETIKCAIDSVRLSKKNDSPNNK